MGLDIRLPLGLLFLITGLLLMGYGLMTHGSSMYELSDNININLVWGFVMAVGGAISFWAGRQGKSR